MATRSHRLPNNAPGPIYVDDTCIDCDMCRSDYAEFFRRDDDLGQSYVHRQPVTPEEWQRAEQAVEGCPSESIGSDGEKA